MITENICYDIDNIGNVGDEDVEVCQYLRPDGRKRKMAAPLGKEYKEKVKGLVIAAEELMNGSIVIYIRHGDQPEEDEQCRVFQNDSSINDGFKEFIDDFVTT
jgi:hypothetical protein